MNKGVSVIGSRIREYEIISILAKGSIWTVFLAEHENHGRYAFKMLAPELSANEQFRERFQRESQSQLTLKHENIVKLKDIIIHNEILFIVEDYVDGHPLSDILTNEISLSRKRTLSILIQVLRGLAHAHDKGVIHRDLKPSNILITGDDMAKVADLGLAFIAEDYWLSRTGTTMGTAYYMSPEQILNPHLSDHRTDIYAVGIMLFEMLTGYPPFHAPDVFNIFDMHLHDSAPDLPEFFGTSGSRLPGILAKTLAKDPAERYESCYELAEGLEQCLGENQPETEDKTPPGRPAHSAGAYRTPKSGHARWPGEIRHDKQDSTHSKTAIEAVGGDITGSKGVSPKARPSQFMAGNIFPLKTIADERGSRIRSDIEGELILLKGPESQYAKVLSLDVAWHMELFETLSDDFGSWCSSVEQDFEAGCVVFTYLPDIRPLDLQGVRAMLRLNAPMLRSRIARLVLELSFSLQKVLSESGAPQLLIHPERLAVKDNGFTILPTLSGPLPHLSKLTEKRNLRWLIFSPPELLRTRFLDPRLSPAAEIFSLGRTLQIIAAGDWLPPVILDGFQYIQGVVEDFEYVPIPPADIAFDAFLTLTRRMTEPLPENRPTLGEVIDQARQWVAEYSPEKLIRGLIRRDKLEDAGIFIQASDELGTGPFAMEKKTVYLLQADLELARSPRGHAKAIDQLNRAIRLDRADPELHVRIADVYDDFSKHAQHKSLSANALKQAAILSNWRPDIVERWTKALTALESGRILRDSQTVPMEARPGFLYLLRCKALVEQGRTMEAWNEMVGFFSRFPADPGAYHAAQAAAAGLDPLKLVKWMHENRERPGLAALVAIVWERNGNMEKAEKWRKRAGV